MCVYGNLISGQVSFAFTHSSLYYSCPSFSFVRSENNFPFNTTSVLYFTYPLLTAVMCCLPGA